MANTNSDNMQESRLGGKAQNSGADSRTRARAGKKGAKGSAAGGQTARRPA